MFIESTRMSGQKGLNLTGSLGDVMKESAQAALSYVRTHAAALGIAPDFYDKSDIHVHVPAGAIPKDGPSGGVTIAASLASLLSGRPVRSDIAMTGEITLRGKVLPVGGIKEKVLAARRAGIKTIILPRRNERDLEDIQPEVRKELEMIFVDTVDEVIRHALRDGDAVQPGAEAVAANPGNRAHRKNRPELGRTDHLTSPVNLRERRPAARRRGEGAETQPDSHLLQCLLSVSF